MRLSNTNNFSASFNVATPYQMVVIHSSKLIYPRELYQRGIQRKRVELIARDFNEYTANEPKISFRNGRYYVTDGQHTIEARILRNGGKDLPILCKVYTGLTMQQEALFFAEQNGHAAPLTAGIKLRAKVVGEDALSMAFLAATNRVGLDFNYDSLQLSDYRISCTQAVQPDGRENLLRGSAADCGRMGGQTRFLPCRSPEGCDVLRGSVSR